MFSTRVCARARSTSLDALGSGRLFGQEVCEGLFPLLAASAMLSKKTGERSTDPDLPAQ